MVNVIIRDWRDFPTLQQILLEESSLETQRTGYVPNWTHPKYNPLRSLNGAAPALCQQDTRGTDESS